MSTKGTSSLINYGNIFEKGKDINIFEQDLILIPLFIPSKEHWVMVKISINTSTITYFDSLGFENKEFEDQILLYLFSKKTGQNLSWNITNFSSKLQSWEKKNQFKVFCKDWKFVYKYDQQNKLQNNVTDCGLFTMAFGLFSSSDQEITITQEDINDLRKRFKIQILNMEI